MRPTEEYKNTMNRAVYNKLRKKILEKEGLIRCSRCGYHRGENDNRKVYNIYEASEVEFCQRTLRTRRPSWKLTSKSPKQWMDNGVRLKKRKYFRNYNGIDYLSRNDFEITW